MASYVDEAAEIVQKLGLGLLLQSLGTSLGRVVIDCLFELSHAARQEKVLPGGLCRDPRELEGLAHPVGRTSAWGRGLLGPDELVERCGEQVSERR